MRIFCGLLLHESNGFSPLPTTFEDFTELDVGATASVALHDLALHSACYESGHEVVAGPSSAAMPSAPVDRSGYERLRGNLVARLEEALPCDAVVLFLHGAQMAEGCDDCQGDIVAAVRQVIGPKVTLGVLVDLHCNLSPTFIELTDVIVACKEYPHTDFHESARQLVSLVERTVRGEIRPVMAFQRVPMLGFFHTTREPMRSFVGSIRSQEQGKVLSISLAHGFPAGDCEHLSAGVLVVAHDDESAARDMAKQLAHRFFALRNEICTRPVSAERAVDQALAVTGGPTVIADVSDNPGGGSPGDSTHLLSALMARGRGRVALASIWDPVALDLIRRAGVGARLGLRLGGKTGPMAGDPIDLDVTVRSIVENSMQRVFGADEPIGLTAVVQCNDIAVVVAQERFQVHSPQVFDAHGLDPRAHDILVVKSAQHFRTEFEKLAAQIIYASPPGLISDDFTHYPYRKLRRPVWPLDPTPYALDGESWD